MPLPGARTGSLVALIVEANAGDARLLHHALSADPATPFRATHVTDLGAALTYLAQTAADVVFLDLSLPDAQGLAALEGLRTVQPDLPIIIVTGLDHEHVALEALQQGAQEYVVKGQLERTALLRAVRSAMVRKRVEAHERLQAAAALTAAHDQLAAILRTVDDGITVQTPDGRHVYANAGAARLCGYPSADALTAAAPGELAGKFTIMDADGQVLRLEQLPARRALRGEEPAEMLLRWRVKATGEEHWSLARSTPLRDAAGRVERVVNVFRDVTALKQAEDRYRSIFETAREAIFRTTGSGRFAAANPATATLLGYATPAQLLAEVTALQALFVQARRVEDLVALLQTTDTVSEFGAELWRRDGTTCWVSLNVHRIDPQSGHAGLQGTAIDITDRHRAEAFRYQAMHDPLTGLANRVLFTEQLDQTLAVAQGRGMALAVLLIDLDGFKAVNDTHGHAIGDGLLQQLGQRLQQAVREADTVARIGGDEFSLLLVGTGVEGAVAIAEKLLVHSRLPFTVDGASLQVGMSIGIAVFPDHGATPTALVHGADIAMYSAKLEECGYAVAASSAHGRSA